MTHSMMCDHCDGPINGTWGEDAIVWCKFCWHEPTWQKLLNELGEITSCSLIGCTSHASWETEPLKSKVKAIPKVYRCPQCRKVHP
jgi:hypothetical protein